MTQKAIGPSFYDELVAYGGLIGAHFSWASDGTLEFFEDTPESVVSGVQSVYAAHDPAKQSASDVREQRDTLIAESDWIVNRHRDQTDAGITTSLTAAEYQAWITYRQGLRDITKQSGWPGSITWPTAPSNASAGQ